MFIYSQSIVRHIEEIQRSLKEILQKEAGLRCTQNRFYDRRQKTSYPIRVVIYNNRKMLGYFDPAFYELGFHLDLFHGHKKQLHNVIRHELAHYLTWIEHGPNTLPHGPEFKAFCKKLGWGDEVSRATTCLEEDSPIQEEPTAIFRKVQKLLALSTSSSANEAEQAMLKARHLLLKHDLETPELDSEEPIVLKRILKQKKETAKMRAIAKILQTFFVSTVYHRGTDFICLEILGQKVHVEIGEYVASVLENELERLWPQAQKENKLKGTVAKNSFFMGLAKGYCDKAESLKQEERALMVIQRKLTEATQMAYPRLSTVRSKNRFCKQASALGERMGQNLNIRPAVNKESSKNLMLERK